jgi:glycosyltransferase involved in cell wall biosynthesis
VLSSDFEGVPAVAIEALAAGLPIVATRCATSIPMLVEGAGRLVPIKDVSALAEAMDAVLGDAIDPSAMRARARSFTTEATVAQWAALFESICTRDVRETKMTAPAGA